MWYSIVTSLLELKQYKPMVERGTTFQIYTCTYIQFKFLYMKVYRTPNIQYLCIYITLMR